MSNGLLNRARALGVIRDIGGLTSIVEQCMRTIRTKEHFLAQLRESLPADQAEEVAAELELLHDRLVEAIAPQAALNSPLTTNNQSL